MRKLSLASLWLYQGWAYWLYLKFKSHAASIKQGATVLGTFHIYKCEESFITSRKERLRQISEPHCTSWGVLGGGSMIHQKICEAIKPFAESAQNLKQTAGDWAIESLYTCRYCTATCSQQQCTSISPVIFEHWDRLQLSKEFKRTSRMRMDSYHALQLLLPIHSLGRIVPTHFKVFSLHALLYLQHTKAAVYSSNRSAAFAKLRQRFDVPSAPYPHRHQTYRSVEQENTDQKGIEDTNEQKKTYTQCTRKYHISPPHISLSGHIICQFRFPGCVWI